MYLGFGEYDDAGFDALLRYSVQHHCTITLFVHQLLREQLFREQ
jgi:hypothetical protein